MPELKCIVVTPERTALEAEADFVVLPLFDGELGVLPGHAPMIGRLTFGELRLKQGGQTVRYFIEGGFAEVLNDVISVVTTRGTLAEDLDIEEIEAELEQALSQKADTDELLAKRERAVAIARARLRVALRAHH